jgi:DNA-binding NarL/FixJ family response regulator
MTGTFPGMNGQSPMRLVIVDDHQMVLDSGEFWPGAHLGLTQRESEVLSLLVAGLSNRAIAAKLVVSEETVKTHSRGIYRKLGVSDRAAAVTVALREGVFH